MSLIDKENIRAAQDMYTGRLDFLQTEIVRIVRWGEAQGEEYEISAMRALDDIEKELEGIDECLDLLNHLFWS